MKELLTGVIVGSTPADYNVIIAPHEALPDLLDAVLGRHAFQTAFLLLLFCHLRYSKLVKIDPCVNTAHVLVEMKDECLVGRWPPVKARAGKGSDSEMTSCQEQGKKDLLCTSGGKISTHLMPDAASCCRMHRIKEWSAAFVAEYVRARGKGTRANNEDVLYKRKS